METTIGQGDQGFTYLHIKGNATDKPQDVVKVYLKCRRIIAKDLPKITETNKKEVQEDK